MIKAIMTNSAASEYGRHSPKKIECPSEILTCGTSPVLTLVVVAAGLSVTVTDTTPVLVVSVPSSTFIIEEYVAVSMPTIEALMILTQPFGAQIVSAGQQPPYVSLVHCVML